MAWERTSKKYARILAISGCQRYAILVCCLSNKRLRRECFETLLVENWTGDAQIMFTIDIHRVPQNITENYKEFVRSIRRNNRQPLDELTRFFPTTDLKLAMIRYDFRQLTIHGCSVSYDGLDFMYHVSHFPIDTPTHILRMTYEDYSYGKQIFEYFQDI